MCSVTAPSQLRLPCTDRAPRLARAFLTKVSCPRHGGRTVEDAELLVSELVTNAIRHGTPPVTMSVHCQGEDGLHVSVSDENPHQSPVQRDANPDAESGRGVRLIEPTCERWGVHRPRNNTKEVWFTLLP